MKDRVKADKSFYDSKLMHFLLLALVMIQVSLPENALATSLQKLTTDTSGFVMGDVKGLAIGGGALFGYAAALFKASMKLAGIVTAILVLFAGSTAWQNGGMTIFAGK